jgi:hypothetical protein
VVRLLKLSALVCCHTHSGPNWRIRDHWSGSRLRCRMDHKEATLGGRARAAPNSNGTRRSELVHEDIDHQVKAGFTEVVFWEAKDNLPAHLSRCRPLPSYPKQGRRRAHHFRPIVPRAGPPQQARRPDGEVVQGINQTETTVKLAPTEPVHELEKFFRASSTS